MERFYVKFINHYGKEKINGFDTKAEAFHFAKLVNGIMINF